MGTQKLKLAVFISGRGSNLQALIDSCAKGNFPAEISLVLSDRPDAYGLKRAEEAGIKTELVSYKEYSGREDFEKALIETLSGYEIDLICLAGFMRILTPHFINHWKHKLINIHPSLLPDYKGLNTHERALADGKKESGCTVHYVVPEVDSGPIIVQKRVEILENDTPDSLAERILEQEHIAYPEAVRIIAEERLSGS